MYQDHVLHWRRHKDGNAIMHPGLYAIRLLLRILERVLQQFAIEDVQQGRELHGGRDENGNASLLVGGNLPE